MTDPYPWGYGCYQAEKAEDERYKPCSDTCTPPCCCDDTPTEENE